jgi:hypothetical protein
LSWPFYPPSQGNTRCARHASVQHPRATHCMRRPINVGNVLGCLLNQSGATAERIDVGPIRASARGLAARAWHSDWAAQIIAHLSYLPELGDKVVQARGHSGLHRPSLVVAVYGTGQLRRLLRATCHVRPLHQRGRSRKVHVRWHARRHGILAAGCVQQDACNMQRALALWRRRRRPAPALPSDFWRSSHWCAHACSRACVRTHANRAPALAGDHRRGDRHGV